MRPGVPATDNPPCVAERVTKTYGHGDTAVPALRGVDLTVPWGHFLAVMGPSGSGKTTLLRCAAALETVTTGGVSLLGRDTGRLSETKRTLLRRDHAAFVFQDYTLLPTLDVRHNVTAPFVLAGRTVPDDRVDELLHTMGLSERRRDLPNQLSGGQQQRVALARALATDADIVFADEPTGSLDNRTGRTVLEHLRSVVGTQRSVVMVTHDAAAASAADEVVILLDGRIANHLRAASADEINAALLRASAPPA